MSKKKNKYTLVFSDKDGTVFDYPGLEPMFRSGREFYSLEEIDCIPLPYGTLLFSLPHRHPVYYDSGAGEPGAVAYSPDGDEIWAVSSFLPSGYLRTYLPAFQKKEGADNLTLWAYGGVAVKGDDFVVPAVRIDDDPRSDPELHENEEELQEAIKRVGADMSRNRLINQLAMCSTEYRCLCARNFFLGRYEAPVPTTPSCNASCIGCLSNQESVSGFEASQQRLDFQPTPEEISQVIIRHITGVERAIASFGQGCEGEPLLRGNDLAEAVKIARNTSDKGTIHLNTNGSLPEMAEKMINAGLDSIRISMNSPTIGYYNSYYRPGNYTYEDVLKTISISLDAGIFVSINLLFLPGFTDMESEIESLYNLLEKYPVNMIQTRNLNIDPDYYFDLIDYKESKIMGIPWLLDDIKRKYPQMKIGYYNPYVGD